LALAEFMIERTSDIPFFLTLQQRKVLSERDDDQDLYGDVPDSPCRSGPSSIHGAVQPTLGKRRACLTHFTEQEIPKVSPSLTCSAFTLELAQRVETLMRRTIEPKWFQ
jgi:hypothetical protein